MARGRAHKTGDCSNPKPAESALGQVRPTSSLFWRGAEQQFFFCVAYHRGN
jgi:hypothetical protein